MSSAGLPGHRLAQTHTHSHAIRYTLTYSDIHKALPPIHTHTCHTYSHFLVCVHIDTHYSHIHTYTLTCTVHTHTYTFSYTLTSRCIPLTHTHMHSHTRSCTQTFSYIHILTITHTQPSHCEGQCLHPDLRPWRTQGQTQGHDTDGSDSCSKHSKGSKEEPRSFYHLQDLLHPASGDLSGPPTPCFHGSLAGLWDPTGHIPASGPS